MNVLFTCGGTAGHVNPALAIAGYMKEKQSDLKILFVGTPNGIEKGLVEKVGYDYVGIDVDNFHRNLKEIKHNLHTVKTIMESRKDAQNVIDTFHPDLIVGTGGYASYPMLSAAGRNHIPCAVHESNMIPGLTTKMVQDSADVIMVGFEDCKQHYKNPDKVQVTGTPARGEFFKLTKLQAREQLGIQDDRPLVVSFWGSLGASTMNEKMLSFFKKEKEQNYPFHHMHACGKKDYGSIASRIADLHLDANQVDVKEYIYNMDVAMRAADVIISRAGASTISEVTALGIPTILVPSPFVVNNHQEKNARVLEKHGGAVVLLENDINGEDLYNETKKILDQPEIHQHMSENMAKLGILDATERIYTICMELVKGKGKKS